MLFIVVTNDEALIFVKAYACYYLFLVHWQITRHAFYVWGPQGFWGSGEKGYLFSGSLGALLIILGELESKHILLGI